MSSSSFKLACIAVIAFCAATQVTARSDVASTETRAFKPNQSVVEIIVGNPEKFAALTAALVETDLVDAVLGLPEPYTVMAPLNSAFCRLGARVLSLDVCSDSAPGGNDDCPEACWLAVIEATKDSILPNILLSHVVTSRVTLGQLKRAKNERNAITTIGTYVPDGTLFFFESLIFKNGDESVLCKVLAIFNCFPLYSGDFSNTAFVKTSIRANNGVVWPIDSILDPLTAV